MLEMAKRRKGLGKERLQYVIDICRSIQEKGLDPFSVDVENMLEIVRKYFPEWKDSDELCLDAEAVLQVASAVNLQSEWVKHRSTSLYTNPFLLQEKLLRLPEEEISEIFLKSWHPIVELEQISPNSLKEAAKYWAQLVPFDERLQSSAVTKIGSEAKSNDELLKQLIGEREFSETLETFWQELMQKVKDHGRIEYWNFIGAETYSETVRRAYLTSFLVTYGYATLEVDRLEETVHIKPYKTPKKKAAKRQGISLPIPVTAQEWKNWKEGTTA